MALLDNVFKQRMVGALVLIAVAVIFLPMLFTREDETRQVQVDAPSAPQAPAASQIRVDPVPVPEPQALPKEPVPNDDDMSSRQPPSMPIAPAPSTPAAPRLPAPRPRSLLPSRHLRLLRPRQPLRHPPSQQHLLASMPTGCRSAGRFNWQACPTVPTPTTCKRPCELKATTLTFALPMALIGYLSARLSSVPKLIVCAISSTNSKSSKVLWCAFSLSGADRSAPRALALKENASRR